MLKNILILLNLVSFILFGSILGENVNVTQKFPTELKKGETYTIEVAISKGALPGFAKFQQSFPEGFTATEVETQGASFTFSDQKVKFIWMALPEAEEFVIKYNLEVGENAPTTIVVDGKFSFIDDNERKTFDLPRQDIAIVDEAMAEEESEAQSPASANCKRTVTKVGDNTFKVEITIEKEGIEGFAKLQDYIPEDLDADVNENKLAVFSTVDDKAKFVWMSIPEDNPLVVSYTISGDETLEAALSEMEGEFSFLSNNETSKVAVDFDGVIGGGGAVADVPTTTPEETPTNPEENAAALAEEEAAKKAAEEAAAAAALAEAQKAADDAEAEKLAQEKVENQKTAAEKQKAAEDAEAEKLAQEKAESQKAAAEEQKRLEEQKRVDAEQLAQANADKTNAVTSTPAPQTGINYRVQIVAGHKMVDKAHFVKVYNYQSDYYTENHEGWIKYTAGAFGKYKEARDKRNEITSSHNFPGPFVTAYNAGERITVQEALMITNQRWFK